MPHQGLRTSLIQRFYQDCWHNMVAVLFSSPGQTVFMNVTLSSTTSLICLPRGHDNVLRPLPVPCATFFHSAGFLLKKNLRAGKPKAYLLPVYGVPHRPPGKEEREVCPKTVYRTTLPPATALSSGLTRYLNQFYFGGLVRATKT